MKKQHLSSTDIGQALDTELDLKAKEAHKQRKKEILKERERERYKKETPGSRRRVGESVEQAKLRRLSRTTVRLNLTKATIASCLILIEALGGNSANMSYSLAAQRVLEGAITTAVKNAVIPHLEETQARDFLRKRDAILEEVEVNIETIDKLDNQRFEEHSRRVKTIQQAIEEQDNEENVSGLLEALKPQKS